jgi:hypothetical protein
MANTLKFGNGEWYGKRNTILAYNDENNNYKPLPFDFSRESSATKINENGLIKKVDINEAKVDYKNNTEGALLLEPSRTNLILTSASGTYGNSPGSEANTTSPDGTNNAIIPTPDSNADRYERSIGNNTYATDTKLVYSWYRKRISTPTDGSFLGDLHFKVLVNVTQVGSTTQIQSDVNGFDRFQAVLNITDGSSYTTIRAYFGQIIGIGNSSVAYFGHQLEVGSYATSYIPTQGSTVTRLSDICNNGGNEQVFNDSEGVLYAEVKGFEEVPSSSGYITISSPAVSFTNAAVLQFRNNGDLRFYFGGSAQANIQFIDSSIDFTENNKIAVQYDSNGSNYKMFVNGVSISRYSSATNQSVSGLSELNLNYGTGLSFIGEVKDIRVYNNSLTDEELQSLTTI